MAILSFTATFDYTFSPTRIRFVDTSDYAGQGIATSVVNGSFRIVSPSGATIYNNTSYTNGGCDIDVNSSTSSQQTISFTPELGGYSIIYTVYDSNLAVYYTVTQSYTNSYVKPSISITQTANVIGQIWTQEDITDYVVNGVTPTKTLVNKLYYPAGSAGYGSPLTKTTAVLSTTTFYNGTQTSEVTATLTYVFTDGLVVSDVITGSKEKKVDGSYYCSVLCCIKTLERTKESYRGSNPIKFKEYDDIFQEVMGYVSLIRLSIECDGGASTDITWYLETIRALSNCTTDCDCGDDEFSRITGWGSVIGVDGTDGADGADGTDGADGSNGVSVISNNITVNATHNGAYTTLKSFSIPANTLVADGDALDITVLVLANGVVGNKNVKVILGGVDAMPKLSALGYLSMPNPASYQSISITITRTSLTTVFIKYDTRLANVTSYSVTDLGYSFWEPSISVADLSLNTNLLDIQGVTTSTDTIVCKQLLVTYLKKS